MTEVDQAASAVRSYDIEATATEWLVNFVTLLEQRDLDAVATLFHTDGWWRDLLAMTWDFRTFHGVDAISGLVIDDSRSTLISTALSAERAPAMVERNPKAEVIEALFDFETENARGRGVLRLTPDRDRRSWKAWTLLTTLEEIRGLEFARGADRPVRLPGASGRPGENWLDWRRRVEEFVDAEPEVLVLGGGHCGLVLAANLEVLGVSTLVVERNDRIGDNWRKRYHSLTLHDTVWSDHLPYLSFPESWPVHTPKDKLADWLEFYAKALDLNIWSGAELLDASYDDSAGVWTAQLRRADGEVRVVQPRHIVVATGVHGEPFMPAIGGLDRFQGEIIHSTGYTGVGHGGDVKAVVVGAGNSGHDIAEDLHKSGAEVTMVQRSSTYVMSQKHGVPNLYGALYHEGGAPVEVADLIGSSFPYLLALERAVRQTQIIAELDADLLSGLQRAGFRTDLGINGAGGLSKILTGPGSYYIEVGCSQLIADGEIAVAHGDVDHLTETGVVFCDGGTLDADLIVFATGYKNMRETARRIFGDEVADRCAPVWGLNEEGEINSMWRNSGHPGFWFMGGPLHIARFYSKFLALQIQAIQRGITTHPAADPKSG